MGAFIGYGDVGIWVRNGERNCFLEWFAENRCITEDVRWKLCKSEALRWAGCCIELSELIPKGKPFAITSAERTLAIEIHGPDFAAMLDTIAAITSGDWKQTVDSKEAIFAWRPKPTAGAKQLLTAMESFLEQSHGQSHIGPNVDIRYIDTSSE